jgi:riboflavin synthase
MFTGLVMALGRVSTLSGDDEGATLTISSPLAAELAEGDSVAVNGVCLTATSARDGEFDAAVMNQTLSLSSLGQLHAGDTVNLELPLRAGDRLGGHLVQGHVDGLGQVTEVHDDGFARRVRVSVAAGLERYIVEHGSIAVDGVSLTVAELRGRSFTVSLIPETIERTNLGGIRPGMSVNLEVDVVARYVEQAVRTIGAEVVAGRLRADPQDPETQAGGGFG